MNKRKIDRSFVKSALVAAPDAIIVRTTSGTRAQSRFAVLVKGAEDQDILALRKRLGYHQAPRRHRGWPMAPAKFEELVRRQLEI